MTEQVSTDKLVEDLQLLVRDAEALLKATATQTGDRIQEVRSRAEESVRATKQRLAELEDEAVKRAREMASAADDYVRENAWQSVGIAAGIGLLVGLLLRRR